MKVRSVSLEIGIKPTPDGSEPVVTPTRRLPFAEVRDEQQQAAFKQTSRHSTVPADQPSHAVPLSKSAGSDPVLGAKEVSGKVSDKLPTPTRPPGYSPRQLWQEIVVMGTGHEAARALIGRRDLLEKLKGVGFDASVASEWRTFFHGIDVVSSARGSPNPSAKGRAEFADWVVVMLGGQSSGLWKGAA